jgi:hypothetical protein
LQQSSSCHINLENISSCQIKNVLHNWVFRFLTEFNHFRDDRAVKEKLSGHRVIMTPQGLKNWEETWPGYHVGLEKGKHFQSCFNQGWASTTKKKVLYCAHCWLDKLTQGADALLVGVVPVPGEGLHPGPPRQSPRLDHSLRDLVGCSATCGEQRVGGGQGHEIGVKILQ